MAKKTKRSLTKYPNLYPELNLKTRYEEIQDINSYIHKLNEKEKAWLNKFVGESINASFNKVASKNLHKKKSQRLDAYSRNNARNRDILTRNNACGKTEYLEELSKKDTKIKQSTEDDLIDKIDLQNAKNLQSTNNRRKNKSNDTE